MQKKREKLVLDHVSASMIAIVYAVALIEQCKFQSFELFLLPPIFQQYLIKRDLTIQTLL